MHVIFMGPQGVGKGTQATRIAEQLELVHVSTGELFRNAIKAKTPLGLMAKEILDRGDLVPDDITLGIVETRLEEIAEMRSASGHARGALFDGFPRTPAQAKGLDDLLEHRGERLVTVIEITAPRDVLVERLSGRRVCPNCGAVYHMEFNPPKVDSVCDNCGHQIIQRADDTPEVHAKRLKVFFDQTAPLIEFYQKRGQLVEIDGEQPIPAVTAALQAAVEAARSR